MSQISLSDGITTINVDQNATLELSQAYEPIGGSIVHRMLNGGAIKQTHWTGTKRRITISGSGWVPPGLGSIDYTVQLTLTARDPADVGGPEGAGVSYTIFAEEPRQTWDINQAKMTWTLVGEEV